MEINTEYESKVITVFVSGDLDAVTAPELEKALSELIGTYAKPLVVNLEGVEYISSAGLRVILSTGKKMKEIEKQIFLAGLSGAVKKVFEISGFYEIFDIFDTNWSAKERL